MFLDLADILADSVADAKMSNITWIIIILIVVSIIVTVTEVGLRFGMLSREKGRNGREDEGPGGRPGNVIGGGDGEESAAHRLDLRWVRDSNLSVEELRLWARELSERERRAVCGAEIVGETFAGV